MPARKTRNKAGRNLHVSRGGEIGNPEPFGELEVGLSAFCPPGCGRPGEQSTTAFRLFAQTGSTRGRAGSVSPIFPQACSSRGALEPIKLFVFDLSPTLFLAEAFAGAEARAEGFAAAGRPSAGGYMEESEAAQEIEALKAIWPELQDRPPVWNSPAVAVPVCPLGAVQQVAAACMQPRRCWLLLLLWPSQGHIFCA